jgi:hypothetical protein
MRIALDGVAPWGKVAPMRDGGMAPLVLYRQVGTSYCYAALRSQELRARLEHKGNDTVAVEYNIISDFGRKRGYTARSVDGFLLIEGERVINYAEQFGGQILTDGNSAPNCW